MAPSPEWRVAGCQSLRNPTTRRSQAFLDAPRRAAVSALRQSRVKPACGSLLTPRLRQRRLPKQCDVSKVACLGRVTSSWSCGRGPFCAAHAQAVQRRPRIPSLDRGRRFRCYADSTSEMLTPDGPWEGCDGRPSARRSHERRERRSGPTTLPSLRQRGRSVLIGQRLNLPDPLVDLVVGVDHRDY